MAPPDESRAAAPPADRAPDDGTRPPLSRHDFSLELGLGASSRLGQSDLFRSESTFGAVYALGFWLGASDATRFGLELEHAGLGSGSTEQGANVVDVDYAVSTAWLGGRFSPWASPEIETFVSLRLGLALQHVDARGARQGGDALARPTAFSCEEVEGPRFALGGGIGAAFALGPRLSLFGRLDASGQRLSSELVGACAVGIGAATSVAAGLGVAYGFDGPASSGDDPFAGRARARSARLRRDSSALPR